MLAQAHDEGFVITLFGRRRVITGLNAVDMNVRARAKCSAVRALVQGTASDIFKQALGGGNVAICRVLPPQPASWLPASKSLNAHMTQQEQPTVRSTRCVGESRLTRGRRC
ncbi:DNA polymerase [Adhaeretor mobilis]|uniref:DNA polymerase n=1 Tax=Adhaeretor mobilis TaxID=1930276 RepID=UPI00119FF236